MTMGLISGFFISLQSSGVICSFFLVVWNPDGNLRKKNGTSYTTGEYWKILLPGITTLYKNNEILLCKLLECYAARPYHPFMVPWPLCLLKTVFKRARSPRCFYSDVHATSVGDWHRFFDADTDPDPTFRVMNREQRWANKISFRIFAKIFVENKCFCEDILYVRQKQMRTADLKKQLFMAKNVIIFAKTEKLVIIAEISEKINNFRRKFAKFRVFSRNAVSRNFSFFRESKKAFWFQC